jgi:mono/diheme cytochrome c family protein
LAARRLLCLTLAATALALAGCNARTVDFSGADTAAGKELFVKDCGSCHTLADAATAGTVGPNLDDAFAGARSKSGGDFDKSTFFQITLDQMRLAAPPMPHFDQKPYDYSEEQLVNVAAYVAGVAGVTPQQAQQAAGGTTTAATTTAP